MIAVAGGILLALAVMYLWRPVLWLLVILCVLTSLGVGQAEPYSCQLYRETAKKCAANSFGPCYVQREVDRLRAQCLRDGGNP